MTKSLLTAKQQLPHPRRQVQTLRRIATIALKKGNTDRAQAAIAEMIQLNADHCLGYNPDLMAPTGGTK